MSAELATAESAFEILESIEDKIDVLIVTLDEHLHDNDIYQAAECGSEILELVRSRLILKQFIKNQI